MGDFEVVFDATALGLPNIPTFVLGVSLGALVAAVLFVTRRSGWWFGLAFAALWAVALATFSWLPFIEFREAIAEGRCEIIEGQVQNFVAQPYHGHALGDRFDVDGRRFEISHGVVQPGYARTVSHGGVHLAGRHVRMCVVGSTIAKLAVRRQQWPEMSSVAFRVPGKLAVSFSTNFYQAAQVVTVNSHAIIWAKDFAISDFEVAVAGDCDTAIAALKPVVAKAAQGVRAFDGTGDANDVIAAYDKWATCSRSPTPPKRFSQPAPLARFYSSDGEWTTALLAD